MIKELRTKYKEMTGKTPFNGWGEEELMTRMEALIEPKEPEKDFTRYKELPPPVIEHLEMTWGNWLNYMEMGQVWKKDFGGYGMFIKVPEEFSTEWRKETHMVWDNKTRMQKMDDDGNPMTKEVIHEDIRWKNLKDTASAIAWLNLVKENIINKAADKGIKLPSTKTEYNEGKKMSREELKKSVHNLDLDFLSLSALKISGQVEVKTLYR